MENLFFFIALTAAPTAVKVGVLSLPVIVSFRIGVREWKSRVKREKAERRMAVSLARALESDIFQFVASPLAHTGNLFQHDEEESGMELVVSQRSLVRSKPWLSDCFVPEESVSRIVRVYTLGSTPHLHPTSTPEPKRSEMILLAAAADENVQPVSSSSAKEVEQMVSDFLSVCPQIANPAPPPPCTSSTPAKTGVISWNSRREGPVEAGRLTPSAFAIAGFRQENLQGYPITSTPHPALPESPMAAAIARNRSPLQPEPMVKDAALGMVASVFAA
jgi:hypothetical protein